MGEKEKLEREGKRGGSMKGRGKENTGKECGRGKAEQLRKVPTKDLNSGSLHERKCPE